MEEEDPETSADACPEPPSQWGGSGSANEQSHVNISAAAKLLLCLGACHTESHGVEDAWPCSFTLDLERCEVHRKGRHCRACLNPACNVTTEGRQRERERENTVERAPWGGPLGGHTHSKQASKQASKQEKTR